MPNPVVVLDANVLIAGLRSNRGAAFRLLSLIGMGNLEICLSVPVMLEYEEVLLEQLEELCFTECDLRDLLDYLCSVGKHQEVYFLWRPYLRDTKDDLVLEAAVAGNCDAIISYNRRNFAGAEKFGVGILTPEEVLRRIGGVQ